MLARKSLPKKRLAIFGGLIVVIWGIIGVMGYRYLYPSQPVPSPTPQVTVPVVTPGPTPGSPAARPNPLDLFKNDEFTSLKAYADIPLQPGRLGRDNPFEPPE